MTSVEISQPTQETLEQHCQDICGVNKPKAFEGSGLELGPNDDFGAGFVTANSTA